MNKRDTNLLRFLTIPYPTRRDRGRFDRPLFVYFISRQLWKLYTYIQQT